MKHLLGVACCKGLSRPSLIACNHLQRSTFHFASSATYLSASQPTYQRQVQLSTHSSTHTAVTHASTISNGLNLRTLASPLLFKLLHARPSSFLTTSTRLNHASYPSHRFSASLLSRHTPALSYSQGLAYSTEAPVDNITTSSWTTISSSDSLASTSPEDTSSSAEPQKGRTSNQAKATVSEEHPPGSQRWNQWTGQLQLAGLTSEEAATTMSSAASLMNREPSNTNEKFKTLVKSLLSETGLTADQFRQVLMHAPDFLRVTSTASLVENIKWFSTTLGIQSVEWVNLALGCRPLITLRQADLHRRLDSFLSAGIDRSIVKVAWIQTPELIKLNPDAVMQKFESLKSLFGISGSDAMIHDVWAMLYNSRDMRDRVLFLQLLGNTSVKLADVQHSMTDPVFAIQAVGAHVQASGKTFPQLCSELQAFPGVSEYLENHHVDLVTMTEFRFFKVATLAARPPQDPSARAVVVKEKSPARTPLPRIPVSTPAPSKQPTRSLFGRSDSHSSSSGSSSSRNSTGSIQTPAQTEKLTQAEADAQHPPGSERWKRWTGQLQIAGLTSDQADTAMSSSTELLRSEPANSNYEFKKLASSLIRNTGLTDQQYKQVLSSCPNILGSTQNDALIGNLNWFKVALNVNTTEWVELVVRCRLIGTLTRNALQQRLDVLTRMGADRQSIKAYWTQSPLLLRLTAANMQERFAILESLFGISGVEVMRQGHTAMLHTARALRDRVLFLQLLGSDRVSLADIQHSVTDLLFAQQVVSAHLKTSGKTLPQLGVEVQALPGAAQYMETHNVTTKTMTELKLFQIAILFGRLPEDSSGGTVHSSGHGRTGVQTPRQTQSSTAASHRPPPTPRVARAPSPIVDRIDSAIRRRSSRPSEETAETEGPHLPGSERWNQWSSQLQLLGLTSEEADSALGPVQPMMKRAPHNTDEELKSLIKDVLDRTDLTAEQLKQIAMAVPDILRVAMAAGVAGNLKWFQTTLGVSTDEWVKLVCSCRALILQLKDGLQLQLDDLLSLGLDKAGVKGCWIQTPELLRLRPGAVLDKVKILLTQFPGIVILELLRTDPTAFLHPTKKLRDRILFLKMLGSVDVSFADVRHSITDHDFAKQIVDEHLASSRKSLPQLCSELQAKPGVRELMEKDDIDPATMNEYKYFIMAVIFARP